MSVSFQIQTSQVGSVESNIITAYCIKNSLKKFFVEEPILDKNIVTFGDIDFIQKFYGKNFVPNHYPEFLKNFISRKIWRAESLEELKGQNFFIKPADKYKRFTGQVFSKKNKNPEINKGPYWCSEIVRFDSEWRIYILDENTRFSYYYTDTEGEPPEIDFEVPKNYCGAIDFGILNRRPELIEAHHPLSIGWYGGFANEEKYIKFLLKAHSFLLRT